MSLRQLLKDTVTVVSPGGESRGSLKASVQGNKVFIFDVEVPIEEGGKILRQLPSGLQESFAILQVNYHEGLSRGDGMSHYEIAVRKENSLVPAAGKPTINISHSQGIQIGDGNSQQIIGSLETLMGTIERSSAAPAEKKEAKNRLKALLEHPLVVATLGSAATVLLEKLGKN